MRTNVIPAIPAYDVERLLAAWRRPYARPPSREEIDRLRAFLAGSVAPARHGWSAAVAEAPAAVGLAVRAMAAGLTHGLAADLVFSALLSHAVEGDRAASLVLGVARARRSIAGIRDGRHDR